MSSSHATTTLEPSDIICHMLTQSAAQTLVAYSLINSRLDYCNSLLLGAPAMSLNRYRLQRAQDIAARVVMDAHRRTDAKPLLRQLHWLPVRQRMLFKMAVLTRKAHTTGTPTYLSQHLHQRTATYSTHTFVITPTAYRSEPVNCVCTPSF